MCGDHNKTNSEADASAPNRLFQEESNNYIT